MASTTLEKQSEKTNPLLDKPNARDRLLAALENLSPLTRAEAEMINKAVTEARERSIGENISA